MQRKIMHKYSKKYSKLRTEAENETMELTEVRARLPTMTFEDKDMKWKDENRKRTANY
jgi:hypothetical protein